MKRREFITGTASVIGATYLGLKAFGTANLGGRFKASDTVVLGKTGVRTSRLGMGTGTVGFAHQSHQTALGRQGLSELLLNGYDQGLRLFDTADSYGSHEHVAEALKHISRDQVTVLTKSDNRDAKGIRADLDRIRRELRTEYIDVFLMHCMIEQDWTLRYRGVMDVLSEAKAQGIIRSHGCSCHTIGALRAAALSPWVEVDLVRINPVGSHMDASPAEVLTVLRQMRGAGKGIIGMKILGQGDLRHRPDTALRYALSLDVLDAFTIGAESQAEQLDLVRRIAVA
ncbi:MAG: aldo/keto reductase [Acidobacteria bacterium]|nr:aldo/keto reductase [Acidobacteriota bacterium]